MFHSVYPFEEAESAGQGIIWNCHCGLLGGARSSGWPFRLSCLKGPCGVESEGDGWWWWWWLLKLGGGGGIALKTNRRECCRYESAAPVKQGAERKWTG